MFLAMQATNSSELPECASRDTNTGLESVCHEKILESIDLAGIFGVDSIQNPFVDVQFLQTRTKLCVLNFSFFITRH